VKATIVGQHALFGKQPAGGAGLFLALGGQVDVPPAGEAVFQVPLALAVADEDQTRQVQAAPLFRKGRGPNCALAFRRRALGRGAVSASAAIAAGGPLSRARLRLAAVQVLAQLGGKPFLARKSAGARGDRSWRPCHAPSSPADIRFAALRESASLA
jgi:hypothetical protein